MTFKGFYRKIVPMVNMSQWKTFVLLMEIWGKWGTQTSDYLNYKTITVLSLNENWPCALCVNMFGIDSIHLDK